MAETMAGTGPGMGTEAAVGQIEGAASERFAFP